MNQGAVRAIETEQVFRGARVVREGEIQLLQ